MKEYMTENFRTTEPFDVNHTDGANYLTVKDYEQTMHERLECLRVNLLNIDTNLYAGADSRYLSTKLQDTLFKVKGFVSYKSSYYPANVKMYQELTEAVAISKLVLLKIELSIK